MLGFFVVVGWSYMQLDNFHPFAPNGWAGVQAGAAIVFFAYIGFDAVSTVAEEVRGIPKRDLPIGIIGSLIICTIIYIVVADRVHRASFRTACCVHEARDRAGRAADDGAAVREHRAVEQSVRRHRRLRIGRGAHGRAARLPARPAEDLLLDGPRRPAPAELREGASAVPHAARHDDPHRRRASASCAMFTSIDEMVDLTNIGTLFAFVLVCIGILILRKRDPGRPRAVQDAVGPGWCRSSA